MSPIRDRIGSWALVGLLLAGGCGGGSGSGGAPNAVCDDPDGDGHGVGPGCDGPDCNEWVPEAHEQAECDEWCRKHPIAPGCPCDSTAPGYCYLGPLGTVGTGTCRPGVSACEDGLWGECQGQVLPAKEICDGEDNNCDGETDEGVLSACGSCDPCRRDCTGPEDGCAGWGEGTTPGVTETGEGWLTLDDRTFTLHVIWPSSTGTGEIFRVDTRTLEVQGAYWTGPNHGDGAPGSGDSPSRSAVDDIGNVFISNRAFGGDELASVTKIAADPLTCPDRNRNGRIDTSTGWNDKLAFDGHDRWDDECILWHTVVGEGAGAIARAVILHPDFSLDGGVVERAWVGLYDEERFEQLDPETGELTGVEAPTPGLTPYGAAVDRDGWAWVAGIGEVGRFDTSDPAGSFEMLDHPAGWWRRVIVDENNTPWVSGTDVWRWDRERGAWDVVGLADQSVGNIASDGSGFVWAGSFRDQEHVYRIDNDEELDYVVIETPGVRTFGIAVDFDRQAWAFDYHDGRTAVIDLDTGEVERVLDDCDGDCLDHPYVRGDITGRQRRNAQDGAGEWSKVIEGCAEGDTDWKRLLVGGRAPAGTALLVSAKTGTTLHEVRAASWLRLGPADGAMEFDLDALFAEAEIEDARYFEASVQLQTLDGSETPTLRRVEVLWSCPSVVE